MRILFIGDVVGRSGRAIVLQRLPELLRDWKLDFVAVNDESSTTGSDDPGLRIGLDPVQWTPDPLG